MAREKYVTLVRLDGSEVRLFPGDPYPPREDGGNAYDIGGPKIYEVSHCDTRTGGGESDSDVIADESIGDGSAEMSVGIGELDLKEQFVEDKEIIGGSIVGGSGDMSMAKGCVILDEESAEADDVGSGFCGGHGYNGGSDTSLIDKYWPGGKWCGMDWNGILRVFGCNYQRVSLCGGSISSVDLALLARDAKKLSLNGVAFGACYDYNLSIVKAMEACENAEEIRIVFDQTNRRNVPIYMFRELRRSYGLKKLRYLSLNNLPPTINVRELKMFLKTKPYQLDLSFDVEYASSDFIDRLDGVIDELVQDFKLRTVIRYRGQSYQKYRALVDNLMFYDFYKSLNI